MNKGLLTVLAIILVVAIAGASFYGGMVYGKSQAQASVAAAFRNRTGTVQGQGVVANGTPGANGFFRGQRNGQGGGFTVGTIKQIGNGSLVLTDQNGKDTQVKVTDTTLIEKNQSVKLTDLTQGETVMVSGSAAADGTVTARSVQVAPQGRFSFGGPGGGDGQAPNGEAPRAQATPSQ